MRNIKNYKAVTACGTIYKKLVKNKLWKMIPEKMNYLIYKKVIYLKLLPVRFLLSSSAGAFVAHKVVTERNYIFEYMIIYCKSQLKVKRGDTTYKV